MLLDRHLLWDDSWTFRDVVAKCQATIDCFKANSAFWTDEAQDWENFFTLVGMEYGVNPGWLFTCAQRERSLAGKVGTVGSFDFALGVVGQDKPGTANPFYNGFSNQVVRAARITAWHAGNDWTPRRKGLEPSPLPRWRPMTANTIRLKDDKGNDLLGMYLCQTRAELAQLRFTPHEKVLVVNETIMRDIAPLFY